jgi:hypothetical protein
MYGIRAATCCDMEERFVSSHICRSGPIGNIKKVDVKRPGFFQAGSKLASSLDSTGT